MKVETINKIIQRNQEGLYPLGDQVFITGKQYALYYLGFIIIKLLNFGLSIIAKVNNMESYAKTNIYIYSCYQYVIMI